MSSSAEELEELMNPMPEAVKKVFPGAKMVPLTAEELKELMRNPKPKS